MSSLTAVLSVAGTDRLSPAADVSAMTHTTHPKYLLYLSFRSTTAFLWLSKTVSVLGLLDAPA